MLYRQGSVSTVLTRIKLVHEYREYIVQDRFKVQTSHKSTRLVCLHRLAVQDATLWPLKPRFDSGCGLFFFRGSEEVSRVSTLRQ